jgi:hypothetical protein
MSASVGELTEWGGSLVVSSVYIKRQQKHTHTHTQNGIFPTEKNWAYVISGRGSEYFLHLFEGEHFV